MKPPKKCKCKNGHRKSFLTAIFHLHSLSLCAWWTKKKRTAFSLATDIHVTEATGTMKTNHFAEQNKQFYFNTKLKLKFSTSILQGGLIIVVQMAWFKYLRFYYCQIETGITYYSCQVFISSMCFRIKTASICFVCIRSVFWHIELWNFVVENACTCSVQKHIW